MYNSAHSSLPFLSMIIGVNDTSCTQRGGRETCSRVRNPENVPIVALAVFEADDKKTET